MIKPVELRYIKKTNTLSITFEDGYSSSDDLQNISDVFLHQPKLKDMALDGEASS